MPSSRRRPSQQVEDLRLDRDVERRGRLVGDQELGPAGERHGDHHALAHAAGKIVRIVVDAAAGRRNAAPGRAARSPRSRAAPARRAVVAASSTSAICSPIVQHRVERGHRLLLDQRRSACRGLARISRSRQRQEVAPSNRMRPERDLRAGRRQAASPTAPSPTCRSPISPDQRRASRPGSIAKPISAHRRSGREGDGQVLDREAGAHRSSETRG
mgnify:CR=1 FL=1